MRLATACRLSAATLALLAASFPTLLAAPGTPSQASAAARRPPARPVLAVARLTPRRVLASAVRPARPVVLSGSMRDTNGRPLPGATVWVAGSRQLIAVANAEGNFSLTLPGPEPVSLRCAYNLTEQTLKIAAPTARQFVFVELLAVAARP